MAISDIKEYAHLTEADVEALGRELDAIRRDIEESRGERDARYVRNTIRLQRGLEVGGRWSCSAPRSARSGWLGTGMLCVVEDHREHGARAQRDARAVGLDERPGGPLHHLGVGQRRPVGALEAAPTTTCTTSTPTSWAWTTTWATGCSASPAISVGSRSTSATSPTTRSSRSLFQYGIAIQLLELGKVVQGRDDREITKKQRRRGRSRRSPSRICATTSSTRR